MEPYTIEDIELLRQKSGISYQEAVALLDYHNGSVAHALIDLEKHNKLKEDNTKKEGNRTMNGENKANDAKSKALNILQKVYRSRVKIRKGDTPILNVSVLFAGLSLILAPHVTIIGVIASMILGYQFSFTSMDPEFSSENLEKMVKNAAQNAKSSVSSVVHTISAETQEWQKKANASRNNEKKETETAPVSGPKAEANDAAESIRKQAKEIEDTMDSFFDSNPAAVKYNSAYSAATSGVPTIQVPVQTETRDGEVTKEDDNDGYSSVTIG